MGSKQSVWQVVLCLVWIQNSDRSNGSNLGSVSDVTLPGSPGIAIWAITEAITERKMASHVTMLWKYKRLDRDDAL
jgi:hypothetical protein